MHDVVVEERLERHTHNKIFSRLNCSISIFDYSLHVFFLNKQAAITIYFPFHFAWKERRKTNAANVKHVLLSFNFTFISLGSGSGTGSCGIPTFVFTFLMVLFVCKFNNFNFAPSILWPLCSFIFSPHNTHTHSRTQIFSFILFVHLFFSFRTFFFLYYVLFVLDVLLQPFCVCEHCTGKL